ncbi:hypothetical protein HYPSUDRAFT_202058 [Hypholoma sublateritium FD-334 SS-4]|uniref:Uncharacterized protein n=1 Tax=Hypholoma sublateritium (strain FD-334 SS-4) TaxID=945553 RepID=A0A0D2L6B0_HYPSF|nr:hypothetical protein HYPSUDRAFT_202058 [Hypholoma sublateritium FD-334 SS-4]
MTEAIQIAVPMPSKLISLCPTLNEIQTLVLHDETLTRTRVQVQLRTVMEVQVLIVAVGADGDGGDVAADDDDGGDSVQIEDLNKNFHHLGGPFR